VREGVSGDTSPGLARQQLALIIEAPLPLAARDQAGALPQEDLNEMHY
jgi:hypothetical protein